MRYLRTPMLACGLMLLAGCATQQPYFATHTNTSQLAQIHALHVVSVIDQDKLKAEYSTVSVRVVPIGVVSPAVIVGGALGGAIASAIANHEAKAFAESHIAPLLDALTDYDGRAALRDTLHQGLSTLPVRITSWKTVDTKAADSELLPAQAPAGSAWMILHTEYLMTPDFSGVQVITDARLFVDGANADWRKTPVYKNELTYQSPLLQMPFKDDATRKQMTDAENARYAKLDVPAQIAKANAASPYDPQNATLRRQIADEQLQHKNTLKQIAWPYWSPDYRANWFVKQWMKDGTTKLRQYVSAGGEQTARMLALDLEQPQPVLDASAKRDWTTVAHDAGQTIQDAPDGKVYSIFDGDVTHHDAGAHAAPAPIAPKAK